MPTKLGQNFLKDKNVVKKIIKSANLTSDDLVVEIGPGKGILTEELAKFAGKVLAVEIDKNLVPSLKNKFKEQKNVEIIEGDILKINLKKLIIDYRLLVTSYKIIANLPYYITSKIIRLFLESETPPSEMVLMVQKEVAERIVAKPGQMSILAVSVQYYADAEILFYVGKENFDPAPEVNSAVIRITHNSQLDTQNEEYNKKFFKIVRAGFCARRKTLANNLANSFHMDRKVVEEKMKSSRIKNTARAQELSMEDWKNLAEAM
jgi:16S rRNA (adenine1518-N6/adenine1519-N6)-dimethyltransferase